MFEDRTDAGQQLAKELLRFKGSESVVLALPRGGIVLGVEVARALDIPLGILLVRKISHPHFSEYAIGAVAENEQPIYNEQERAEVDRAWLEKAESEARELMAQRRALYYGSHDQPPDMAGKTAILVDDGIATGLTMEAAARALRSKAKHVVVAVPVAPPDAITMLRGVADEVIVLRDPTTFLGAVGSHYKRFEQVTDDEVKDLLRQSEGI